MDLNELIEMLQDIAENDPTATVKVAFQPNYPLEVNLQAVTLVDGVVYLAGDDETNYAPKAAWGDEQGYY